MKISVFIWNITFYILNSQLEKEISLTIFHILEYVGLSTTLSFYVGMLVLLEANNSKMEQRSQVIPGVLLSVIWMLCKIKSFT